MPRIMHRRLPVLSENMKAQKRAAQIEDPEAATPEELLALENLRPRVRADCEPCAACQQMRRCADSGVTAMHAPGCDHTANQAVCHSRPCIFVGCRHHLASDVTSKYRIVVIDDLASLPETCALDVAEIGEQTLEAIGALLHVTRERVRQMEERAEKRLRKLDEELPSHARSEMKKLGDYRG